MPGCCSDNDTLLHLGPAKVQTLVTSASFSYSTGQHTKTGAPSANAKPTSSNFTSPTQSIFDQGTTPDPSKAPTITVTAVPSRASSSSNSDVKLSAGPGVSLAATLLGALPYIISLQRRKSRNRFSGSKSSANTRNAKGFASFFQSPAPASEYPSRQQASMYQSLELPTEYEPTRPQSSTINRPNKPFS